MGVVQRQGIKNTIIRFAGVAVGVISMLYIYPLNDAIYGYAQYLYNTAMFLIPFISVGVLSLVVKFFPEFSKDSNNNRGFLSYIVIAAIVFFALFFCVAAIFKEPFYGFLDALKMDVEVIRNNEIYLLVIAFLLLFIFIFTAYISNFGRIAVPTFLQNFLFKIFLPVIVLIYVAGRIDTDGVAKAMIIFFGVVLIMIIFYAGRLKALKFGWQPAFLTLERMKRMGSYMTFGAFNHIGSVLTFRIDAIMIMTLLGDTSTGVYFKILIMANIIDIPTSSINKIAGPIISKAWEEGNKINIAEIYQKASVNLLIAGLAIFLVGWFTLDELFLISINPDSFEGGKLIFLFLAAGKLIDMITSVNNPIIIYSKLYKYNLLFILILGISNVIFNYYLIGEFDIVGAALASCIALFIFNLIKLIFIYIKFGMQPFTKPILYLITIAAAIFIIFNYLPVISNPFISIVVNAVMIIVIYASLIYYFKISDDVNKLIDKYWQILLKRN